MLVSQILKRKGDLVFTTSPAETIAAAAAELHARKVGALVVLDAGGQLLVGFKPAEYERQFAPS